MNSRFLAIRDRAADYIVATVIAGEVPPDARTNPHSKQPFTAEMIPLAITAICGVIRQRVKSPRFPNNPVEVVLGIKQFSIVLRGLDLKSVGHRDIWPEVVSGRWNPEHVARCFALWEQSAGQPALAGEATNYYSPVSMVPALSVPGWAKTMREVKVAGLASDWYRFYA